MRTTQLSVAKCKSWLISKTNENKVVVGIHDNIYYCTLDFKLVFLIFIFLGARYLKSLYLGVQLDHFTKIKSN